MSTGAIIAIVIVVLIVLALVLWVGGLIAAGALVAPSVFGVLLAWNESAA